MNPLAELSAEQRAAIGKAVERAVAAWKAPGAAVAVLKDGALYLRGYGVKKLGEDDAVTPDTVFALASVSKAFTTAAIAMLVADGKMKWDEPVRTYLPWFSLTDPAASSCVTVRDLVCHRTGMPRHDPLWYIFPWSREEVVRRYCKAPCSTSFRSTYEYANVPFIAAGLVIEAVSGMSWEKFLTSRIFRPLGMKSTCMNVADAQSKPDHATPHSKHKGKLVALPWLDCLSIGPAGGISTSARDIARWLEFQLNEGEIGGKAFVAADALRETHKPCMAVPADRPERTPVDFGQSFSCYCLGWSLRYYRGHTVLDHGGLLDGFTSAVTLAKREKLAVAVLCNHSGGNVVHAATRGILDSLLGLPQWDWPAMFKDQAKAEKLEEQKKKKEELEKHPRLSGTRPSLPLASYAGDYDNPAYGPLKISCSKGRLTFEYGHLEVPMRHYHLDVFSLKVNEPCFEAEGKAQFLLDPDAQVTSVRVDGLVSCEFARVTQAK